jgi:hypothetical protein
MKRTIRRVAWVGVALCLVALALGVTVRLLGPEPAGVNEANVARIKPGMTLREVEEILGGPAHTWLSVGGLFSWDSVYTWDGPGGKATVIVQSRSCPDGNERRIEEWVESATFERREGVGLLPRLRALLGW